MPTMSPRSFFLVEFIRRIADFVLPDINLDLTVDVLDVHEPGFAHPALGHDPARHRDRNLELFQFFLGFILVYRNDVSCLVGAGKRGTKGIHTHVDEILHLLTPDLFLLRQFDLFSHDLTLLFAF